MVFQQVELSFKTGEVILVYGEMDEDGFFMGELDGVRGLVPSNFLTEAPEQYNNQAGGPGGMNSAQRNVAGRGRGGPGPGGEISNLSTHMISQCHLKKNLFSAANTDNRNVKF